MVMDEGGDALDARIEALESELTRLRALREEQATGRPGPPPAPTDPTTRLSGSGPAAVSGRGSPQIDGGRGKGRGARASTEVSKEVPRSAPGGGVPVSGSDRRPVRSKLLDLLEDL